MRLNLKSAQGVGMYFKRNIKQAIKEFSKFPVVGILGPRQSGKTTFAKHEFVQHTFVTLESPDLRAFATQDPRGFLKAHHNEHGIIIDEFQYVPELLSYIQVEVDKQNKPGYFVLTGSQNFLVNEKITQSLAGRIGILTLLPLSLHELTSNNLCDDVDQAIFKGGYPRLYQKDFSPLSFFPSYIHTYVERDVRQLVSIENLLTFQKFLQLCAGRIGQLLNMSDLATNCGVSIKTIEHWLSIAQASYILFLLRPHFTNFNKRVTKTPKIYFYDTGLACSLLEMRSVKDLTPSPFRGHLFENLIITDLYKQYYNQGLRPPLYFWRDQNGRIEIDCIIDRGGQLTPLEVKSGQTILAHFFNALTHWNTLAKADPSKGYLIYGGDFLQERSLGNVVGWKDVAGLIKKIETPDRSE